MSEVQPNDLAYPAADAAGRLKLPAFWLFLPTLAVSAFFVVRVGELQLERWVFFAALLLVLVSAAGLITRALRLPLSRIFAMVVVAGWWTAFFVIIDYALFLGFLLLFYTWIFWIPFLVLAALHSRALDKLGRGWMPSSVCLGMACSWIVVFVAAASKRNWRQ